MQRAVQAYSKLYYEKKLKAIVESGWEAARRDHPDNDAYKGKAPTLAFRNSRIEEIFENEAHEIKNEVEEYRWEEYQRKKEEWDREDRSTDNAKVDGAYLKAGEESLSIEEQK